MSFSKYLACVAVLLLAHTMHAQLACSGVLSSPSVITSDVTVSGASCTIQGVSITGSVLVTSGGSLTTSGTVSVDGSISVDGGANVNLQGALTVLGDVVVENSAGTTTLSAGATVSKLEASEVANLVVSGSAGSLSALNVDSVNVLGGTVTGGGFAVEGGIGPVTVCGGNISGGVGLIQRQGTLDIVAGPGCAATAITGGLLVEKGIGNVNIVGATLNGADLLVVEQEGNIKVEGAMVSDVSIENTIGDVMLVNIMLDSDGFITDTTGAVTVSDSSTLGDFAVEGAGSISLLNNNFGLETVAASASTGLVNIGGNSDMLISIIENSCPVQFNNNDARDVNIEKNTNGVTISGNTIINLSCVDNVPAPTGSPNTVTFGNGQCAGF